MKLFRRSLLLIYIGLLGCLGAAAQTYDALWKQVDNAIEKDLPQTALAVVKQIYAKAVAETNDGQTLAALLTVYQLGDEIAPDSGRVALQRLEAAANRETRPVVKSLYQCAVAKLQLGQYGDTAAQRRGRELMRHALADEDALAAARTTDYLPLFAVEKGSRYFHDDLLSVVAKTAISSGIFTSEERRDVLSRVLRHYRAAGNREATLLWSLDSISEDGSAATQRAALLRLAAEFKDLGLNVETYNELVGIDDPTITSQELTDSLHLAEAHEGLRLYGKQPRAAALRNVIARIEQPTVSLQFPGHEVAPADTLPVTYRTKNVGTATLRVYRLKNIKASDSRLDAPSSKAFSKIKKELTQTLRLDIPTLPAYRTHHDSLRFVLPTAGVYLVQLTTDDGETDKSVVYASRVLPIVLTASGDTSYVRLVDRTSGRPLKNGRVVAYRDNNGVRSQQSVHEADASGEIRLTRPKNSADRYGLSYYAEVGDDAYSTDFNLGYAYSNGRSATTRATTHMHLYTDRAIYRPGQTLHFGGIVYTQRGDTVEATVGTELKVTLRDANSKRVGEVSCRTDSFGAVSGEFTLPEVCLPGRFALSSNRYGGYIGVRVEEYKRPTFTVEMDEPTAGYTFGDTAHLTGVVKTLSGVPVADARVSYTVERHDYSFYRLSADDEAADNEQRGETVTDSAGRFVVSFPIASLDEEAQNEKNAHFIGVSYAVSVDVTASNGETISAAQSLTVGKRRGRLSLDWGTVLCKEALPQAKISLVDAEGRTLEGEVRWQIVRDKVSNSEGSSVGSNVGTVVLESSMKSGEKLSLEPLKTLVSGQYTVVVSAAEADTVRRAFTLFSEQDVRPAAPTDFFHYERSSAQGDAVTVVIGSSRRDVSLFYDLFAADGRRLESRVVEFSDSLLRFPVNFLDEMGESGVAVFAFVKDGTLYKTTASVIRPRPEKRLQVRWETFRSRLTPGQEETWTLRITHPDGRPADALLMARLYDASLDAFATAPWSFALSFPRSQAQAWWCDIYKHDFWLHIPEFLKHERVPEIEFTTWEPRYFNYALTAGVYKFGGRRTLLRQSASRVSLTTMAAFESGVDEAAAVAPLFEGKVAGVASGATADNALAEEEVTSAESEVTAAESASLAAVTPRSNFAETALFTTALRTDTAGRVALTFTLPESLTSWHCEALAYTRAMDYGLADTTAVAVRLFSVEPALPRFVRRGDRVSLPVTLCNLSEKAESGTLRLTLADAATGETLRTLTSRFKVEAGRAVTKNIDFIADFTASVLVCRVVAVTENFSDGEEHYLPVLTDRVAVMRSVPFSLQAAGTTRLRLDTLFAGGKSMADQRLTVELSSNPAWYAVAALPSLAAITGESAVDNATRYYAVTLAHRIAELNPQIDSLFAGAEASKWGAVLSRNPDLKQTLLAETPWTAEATTEADRLAALRRLFDANAVAAERATALDRLRALQQTDGSWSWFPGMTGNAYITADVALLLARLEALCGDRDASALLDRAMNYLSKEMADDVTEMKKHNTTGGVGETHLRYLYIRALRGEKPDETANFLIKRFAAAPRAASMYDKALFAVVQARAGEKKAAAETLQSLTEHTVATPTMGRYFDTDRAARSYYTGWRSWNFYRIPTQTAAIEALSLTASTADAAMADEMRLWLMQSRRTQMWKTSRATADAVFALLVGNSSQEEKASAGSGESSSRKKSLDLSGNTSPVLYTLGNLKEIAAFNAPSEATGRGTVGYYCHTYTDARSLAASQLTLRKREDGLAWGAVVAQYTVPQTAATASASGLSIERRYEVLREGKWTAVSQATPIYIGARVRQVLTLTADRDYDFVSIHAARAACLAPTQALSGRTWANGLGLYRAVHDTSTDFFADHVAKGRYTLTEEYLVDHAGRYACGASRIQSVYAPEFGGQTAADVVLTVK